MDVTATPVIVIGGSVTALSLQRLAAKLGHPVYAACPSDSPATTTRYYQSLPITEAGCWRGDLGSLGLRHLRLLPFRRAILIPSADDSALWLADLPEELKKRFPVSLAPHNALTLLQDKGALAQLAADNDVAIPASFAAHSRHELSDLALDPARKYFFKPLDSQSFNLRFNVKALSFADIDEALRLWDEYDLESMGVIVQEYVPGAASEHYFIDGFIDRDGTPRAQLARRRLRMYPADFGNSSSCQSVPTYEVATAWDRLRQLLQALNYRGIFSAEFKRDANDGVFRLIEINTRPWIYVEFADACGVNLCDLYVRDALGLDIHDDIAGSAGKFCVNVVADYRAWRGLQKGHRPSPTRLFTTWARAFKPVFRWRDPYPAIRATLTEFKRLFDRVEPVPPAKRDLVHTSHRTYVQKS